MEFREVHDYINQPEQHAGTLEPLENPYNALFQPSLRKPTLSGFVHRLRQQSSKTRFVREYKKMASLFDTNQDSPCSPSQSNHSDSDDASLRISDPNRTKTVAQLMIKTKPLKRVVINESANQICHAVHVPEDHFISLPEALDGLKAQIETLYQQIENETKRIQGYQEEITHYGNQCAWMDNQLNSTHASLYLFYRDTMPQMKAQRERMIQNELKVRIHQKKHIVQKQRFERYRKVMSIDTRLAELKKKIQVAWKQDEVWLGIRDWGLLSIIFIVVMTTIFWPF
ncbi:hypothetical protein BD560DRAFT_415259 [Blakeslea trispora]|nr:hypothetical protein BD560DRAFT_415259 [Blakeslea trispora]